MRKTITRLLGVLLLCIAAVPTHATIVKQVRLGQHDEKTRLVLESTRPLTPKVFTLPSPPRVVMDFPIVEFTHSLTSVKRPPGSLVKRMRQGHFKPRVIRMVLDVKQPVKVTRFNIPANGEFGHRLVLDLQPSDQNELRTAHYAEIRAAEPEVKAKKRSVFSKKPSKKRLKRPGDDFIVMIDPGHGGVDPGAVGYRKTYEKDVVLGVGQYLKKMLDAKPGVKAYLTRDKDVFVKLADRVRKAQEVNADLFVSIHADAHHNRRVNGGSVYVLSEKSSDKEAARLARVANEGDMVAGVDMSHEALDVRDILIDLTQRETMNQSALLARHVLKELGTVTRLRKTKTMFAGFRVLKAPEIPSVLVELNYISNKNEEGRLRSRAYQKKLAEALARGITGYTGKYLAKR